MNFICCLQKQQHFFLQIRFFFAGTIFFFCKNNFFLQEQNGARHQVAVAREDPHSFRLPVAGRQERATSGREGRGTVRTVASDGEGFDVWAPAAYHKQVTITHCNCLG